MALSARGEADAVLAAHRDKMTENEKWAVIEQKWLDSWIKYTGTFVGDAPFTSSMH